MAHSHIMLPPAPQVDDEDYVIDSGFTPSNARLVLKPTPNGGERSQGHSHHHSHHHPPPPSVHHSHHPSASSPGRANNNLPPPHNNSNNNRHHVIGHHGMPHHPHALHHHSLHHMHPEAMVLDKKKLPQPMLPVAHPPAVFAVGGRGDFQGGDDQHFENSSADTYEQSDVQMYEAAPGPSGRRDDDDRMHHSRRQSMDSVDGLVPPPPPPPEMVGVIQAPPPGPPMGMGPMSQHGRGGGSNRSFDDEEIVGNANAVASMSHIPEILKSVIECGEEIPDENGNVTRVFQKHSLFFGKPVEVFFALSDPDRRPLFRPHELAKKFGIHSSRIGMYLNRKRDMMVNELYQATGFKHKSPNRMGIKVGAYFITERACKMLQKWADNRRPRVLGGSSQSSTPSETTPDFKPSFPPQSATSSSSAASSDFRRSPLQTFPPLPGGLGPRFPPVPPAASSSSSSNNNNNSSSNQKSKSQSGEKFPKTPTSDKMTAEMEERFRAWYTAAIASGYPLPFFRYPDFYNSSGSDPSMAFSPRVDPAFYEYALAQMRRASIGNGSTPDLNLFGSDRTPDPRLLGLAFPNLSSSSNRNDPLKDPTDLIRGFDPMELYRSQGQKLESDSDITAGIRSGLYGQTSSPLVSSSTSGGSNSTPSLPVVSSNDVSSSVASKDLLGSSTKAESSSSQRKEESSSPTIPDSSAVDNDRNSPNSVSTE